MPGLVNDVAKHFEDGRLSAVRLAQADDEVMEQDLIAVRGIGKVRSLVALRFIKLTENATL